MKQIWQSHISALLRGVALSYAAIFFSQRVWLGVVILLVTLIYPHAGAFALLSCLGANAGAILLLNDRQKTSTGIYGFNAVFAGLAIGVFFPNDWMMLFSVSILSLLLSVVMEGLGERLRMPFLAFPFLFCLWTVFLVAQQRGEMVGFGLSGENVQTTSSFFPTFLSPLFDDTFWAFLPNLILLFFKSFGLIFFQSNVFSGFVLALALLVFSRIAFFYSFIGFSFAYLLYITVGMDVYGLPFLFYGFNFIFTAMAVGCYFVVPSKSSLLCVLLLVPVVFLVVMASSRFLSYFFLPTFTFPFCVVSISFVYLLGRRKRNGVLELVYYPEATPEATLYSYKRSQNNIFIPSVVSASLPFMGKWTVSQGIDGELTHKTLWRHAWDFVVEDEQGSQFKGVGDLLTDYYCYGKPIVATASGVVVALCDEVDDNRVGEVDAVRNWGNYIVLKHAEGLYSAVCHLKKATMSCRLGDVVEKGAILALCGNSGYSPYPHLHFQFQQFPQMGSPTIAYRIASYVNGEGFVTAYSYPQKGDVVSNMLTDEDLSASYAFVEGKEVQVISEKYGEEHWSVGRDELGGLYFMNQGKKAKAWFVNDGTRFRFLRYEGSRGCALYHFYCSNYHVPFMKGSSIRDCFSLVEMKCGVVKILQDFVAPFALFAKKTFEAKMNDSEVDVHCKQTVFSKTISDIQYKTSFKQKKISEIEISEQNKIWKVLFLN